MGLRPLYAIHLGRRATEIFAMRLKAKIKHVIALLQAKACEKKLAITLDDSYDTARYLIGGPKRIQRIFLELASNAIPDENEDKFTLCHKERRAAGKHPGLGCQSTHRALNINIYA